MIVAPCALNEQERLDALQRYGILDTAADADFDAITGLLSSICETPIALISLVDRDRQWFKSRVGLDAAETHRDLAFCAHAILQNDVLMVSDATRDARFADNPLVLEHPNIRFYAGVPLLTPDNLAIGTLCAIDTKPRTLNDNQLLALKTLARHVVDLLELRLKLVETQQLNQALTESRCALEQANVQRNRFFANINHEMRTPLNAILGFTRRLQKRIQKESVPEYVNEGLGVIGSAATRLGELVDDVLDISKIDAGKMKLHICHFDPVAVLQDVVKMLAVKAEERGVQVIVSIDDKAQRQVSGDEKKIAQVLLNLMSNALKFTPAGRQVTAHCGWRNNKLIFIVEDQGVGIPAQDLERIFIPFEQSTSQIQSEIKGTGLGLAIVKAFVDLMNGSIDVNSSVGIGSRFTVTLPISTS